MSLLAVTAALGLVSLPDGWVTWRVAAQDPTTNWCCVTWSAGGLVEKACELDNKHLSVRSDDERFQPTGEMQLYARIVDGEPQKLRVLSPQCPIEPVADLNDLGRIETSMSVDWLGEQLTRNDSLTSDAIIAISAHEASAAAPMLIDVITDRTLPRDTRKEALRWLIRSKSDEAFRFLDRLFAKR